MDEWTKLQDTVHKENEEEKLRIAFLMPVCQVHKLIILLSQDNKCCFLVITDSFISLSEENKRHSWDNEIIYHDIHAALWSGLKSLKRQTVNFLYTFAICCKNLNEGINIMYSCSVVIVAHSPMVDEWLSHRTFTWETRVFLLLNFNLYTNNLLELLFSVSVWLGFTWLGFGKDHGIIGYDHRSK